VMGEQGSPVRYGALCGFVGGNGLEVRVLGLTRQPPCGDGQRRASAVAPTGRVSDHVAGVRFRAWSQPTALPPSIGVDATAYL